MRYYTTVTAAAALGLSVARVRDFCQAGRLGSMVGRQYLIDPKELAAFRRRARRPGRPRKK